jgi:type III pantothenate kinase
MTKMAVLKNGRFGKITKIKTSQIGEFSFPDSMPVAASSVVPEAKKQLGKLPIFWLCPQIKKTGIVLRNIKTRTLGVDRLANVIAARHSVSLPAIVCDFGTAITFDLIDKKGQYRGGAIIPGRKMMRIALHDHTAQIPIVPFTRRVSVPGTDTKGAVAGGIDIGILGSAKEILHRLSQEINAPKINMIAVGGDSDYFVAHIPGLNQGGAYFTLAGVAIAWGLNNYESENLRIGKFQRR